MSDIYFIDTPPTVHDRIRSAACSFACRMMNRLDHLARWPLLDELRWWIEGQLHELFGIWWEATPDSLAMAVRGEIPLCGIGQWERAQIIDFDDVECCCIECHTVWCTWQAKDDCCADCGGNLYLGEDWSDIPTAHDEEEDQGCWSFQPTLLLTERRAA